MSLCPQRMWGGDSWDTAGRGHRGFPKIQSSGSGNGSAWMTLAGHRWCHLVGIFFWGGGGSRLPRKSHRNGGIPSEHPWAFSHPTGGGRRLGIKKLIWHQNCFILAPKLLCFGTKTALFGTKTSLFWHNFGREVGTIPRGMGKPKFQLEPTQPRHSCARHWHLQESRDKRKNILHKIFLFFSSLRGAGGKKTFPHFPSLRAARKEKGQEWGSGIKEGRKKEIFVVLFCFPLSNPIFKGQKVLFPTGWVRIRKWSPCFYLHFGAFPWNFSSHFPQRSRIPAACGAFRGGFESHRAPGISQKSLPEDDSQNSPRNPCMGWSSSSFFLLSVFVSFPVPLGCASSGKYPGFICSKEFVTPWSFIPGQGHSPAPQR